VMENECVQQVLRREEYADELLEHMRHPALRNMRSWRGSLRGNTAVAERRFGRPAGSAWTPTAQHRIAVTTFPKSTARFIISKLRRR